jgi:hypothetical protein
LSPLLLSLIKIHNREDALGLSIYLNSRKRSDREPEFVQRVRLELDVATNRDIFEEPNDAALHRDTKETELIDSVKSNDMPCQVTDY